MLKILSSKVSVDSDITYMSAVKFIACLGVFAYLNLSKNPHLWTDTNQHGWTRLAGHNDDTASLL